MPIVRKRKGRTMSPTNKRKKVLNENSSESNSEVKVENEFDNLFEEEADLTIKEDLQDIKLDLFNDLNNFGNDSSSKSDNTSNGNHKVSTSLNNGKNRSSNFRNSAKITKIINNQKEAFKLIQSALVKFENVTKELQEMLEIDIEEEQADDLLLQNDLDPSFDSFQITEVEGESSHYFQNSSENGLKNDLDSSINSFQITEVEGESSHYWQNSSEKSATYSQTQEDEIQEKTKECYSKEVPSNVSDKLINHSDKNLESSSSQFSETQEKHKNHVAERSQKTKICVSKPNSSSKLPYVLLRKIDDVNTTISPTPEIGIEHGAKTNFSQNARERVRSTPLNEEECTVNKEIVQNLQIARQSESDSQMDRESDLRMGARDLDILASILEENDQEMKKDVILKRKLVESDIQILHFQDENNKPTWESYEEVMPKIGSSSSASSGMLADQNPQRSHLQEEINESCWDNYKDAVLSNITSSSVLVDPNLQRSHPQDENKEPQIENSQIRKKKKTVKPMRPCLYCKKSFTKVSQHIKRIHADEIDVQTMLSLPKEDQDKEMRMILKRGVYNYNIDLLKNDKSAEVMMLRKQNIKNGVAICEKCSGTYGRSKFYLHKKNCEGGLQIVVKVKSNENGVSEKLFKENILDNFKMASSEVTKLCRTNPIVLQYGKDQFKSIVAHPSKEESKMKRVRGSMRLLARFLLKFVEIGKNKHPDICYEDFINKKYFRIVEETIFVIAINEKEKKVQHSVKLHLQAIINSLIGTLRSDYIIKEDKTKKQSLSDFKELFTQSSKTLFKDAQAHAKLDRTKELRKPMLLPLEDDIKILKNYIYKEISNINMLNEWTKEVFIKARRLSVCFLTLLNVRRSVEASALTIENINKARENKWVDTQKLKSSVKSSAQKSLVDNTKTTFLYGKGNRLVAVTIPVVLIPIIEKLVDPNIRTTCDIDKNNKYAFPSTGNSQGHASGWHEVFEVCTNAKLSNNITTDEMRHRAATIFEGMDVSENFKNLIHEHIGHSKEIDRGIYSAPPANNTILKIAPKLNNMMHLDTPTNFEESSSDEGILDTQGTFQTLNQTTSECENETTTENTENSLRTSQDSTSGENDSSFHKVCHKRKYNKWNIQDTETILEYFSESIGMSAIPKKEEILKFLEKFPTILPQLISIKEKSKAVRTKVMNEISKNKKRRKLFS